MAEINSELVQKIENLNKKKTELETEKGLVSKQLIELDNEIKGKGYDPEKLPEKVQELGTKITNFEKKAGPIVDEISKKLQGVENEQHKIQPFSGFEQQSGNVQDGALQQKQVQTAPANNNFDFEQ